MALGQASFTSKVTQECEILTFWVVHFGDHNVAGGVRKFAGKEAYEGLLSTISESFARVDIPEVVRLLDRRFGEKTYSLRSLFRDEQRRIIRTILSTTVAEAEAAYLQLYEHHVALMRFVTSLGSPMPREFSAAVEYAINSLLRRACSGEQLDGERIRSLLSEARSSNVSLDRTTIEFLLRHKLEALARSFAAEPSSIERIDSLRIALKTANQMPFPVNLWSVQNDVYAIQSTLYPRTRRRSARGDSKAQDWLDAYADLNRLLSIRLD